MQVSEVLLLCSCDNSDDWSCDGSNVEEWIDGEWQSFIVSMFVCFFFCLIVWLFDCCLFDDCCLSVLILDVCLMIRPSFDTFHLVKLGYECIELVSREGVETDVSSSSSSSSPPIINKAYLKWIFPQCLRALQRHYVLYTCITLYLVWYHTVCSQRSASNVQRATSKHILTELLLYYDRKNNHTIPPHNHNSRSYIIRHSSSQFISQ